MVRPFDDNWSFLYILRAFASLSSCVIDLLNEFCDWKLLSNEFFWNIWWDASSVSLEDDEKVDDFLENNY